MPQIPGVPGTTGLNPAAGPGGADAPALRDAVRRVFSQRGALARVLDGYEPREGQWRMADAVAAVLDAGGTLLAEAGTGTGKTLAYLAPAILSGRRVLVSTGTKNLQEQIFFKDLPLLQAALGIRLTATLMKGRSNYLCLHRWETYRDAVDSGVPARGRLIETGDRVLLPIVDAWVKTTQTGDRAELRDLPEDLPLWKEVAAEADTCLGTECRHYDQCFITTMRRRAAESDVVIVNHHLLCADASVRQSAYGEVIPSCSTLVVDEAHQLEDIATHYFGSSVSAFRVDDLVRDVERWLAAGGDRMPGGSVPSGPGEILHAVAQVTSQSRMFFGALAMAAALQPAGGSDARVRYTAESLADHCEGGAALASALDALDTALAAMGRPPTPAERDVREITAPVTGPEAVATLQRRSAELASDLRFLLRAGDSDFVYYVESRARGLFLRASPIDVSRIVRDALFDRMRALVLTSATLAMDDSFAYVRERLGIREADELRVPSEFDYRTQALLYLPRRMPPPRASSFAEAAAREIVEIVTRSRGRAFVLFTSYAVLRTVQRLVEMALPYPILVQGTAPRTMLIERFRSTPHSVLLATSSFWQGVDVAGDALSCVIVDKLPFASPADPVTAARIEAIAARGGDPFAEYQVPLAILALQQGLGRLIRHRGDRGVLAVLDPRLRTMGYGRRFLASLPPAPVTHELDAVARFFM